MDLDALARSTGLEQAEEELRGSEWTLEFVSSLVNKNQAELNQVKLELSKQVHGQVEDAKFAAVIIANAEQDLKHVVNNFSSLSSKLQFLNQASPFEALKRASTAKRNLSQVTEQIDLYRKVPIRVKRLLVELELDSRGANLRRIFREWLGICVWRDRVIGHVEENVANAIASEERSNRRARGEVLPEDTLQLALADSMLPASSQALETQLALLKDHFRDSFLLGDRLTDICLDFSRKLVEVAKKRPQDLVVVAEICELGDRQVNRERRGGQGGQRKQHFLQCLGEYVDTTASSKLASLGPVSFFISRADELLCDLKDVRDYAVACFPPSMDVLQVYRKWTEAHLLRECQSRAKTVVTEEERLELAKWVSQYVAEMPMCAGLERFCDTLVDDHLSLHAMPRIDPLASHGKQAFFQSLKQELSACLPHFTGMRMLKVFQSLVDVCTLQYLQHRKTMMDGTDVNELCEFIDDCTDCEDEVRLLFDSCTEHLLQSSDEAMLAQVIAKAAELVEDACRTLQQGSYDFGVWPLLSNHVFARGANVLTVNTWFFSDRIRIRNESAFARTFKYAFDWLIKQYVQNILVLNIAVSSAEQLELDAQAMLEYFALKCELMWMQREELERRLALLHICAKALRGEEAYSSFLDHFNVRDAKIVLLRLRQLAMAAAATADLDQEFALYENNQLHASRVELDFQAVQCKIQEETVQDDMLLLL